MLKLYFFSKSRIVGFGNSWDIGTTIGSVACDSTIKKTPKAINFCTEVCKR